MMKLLKQILRSLFETFAVCYSYIIFLNITNAKDEITLLNFILMMIYVIVALNLFEWCFDIERKSR